MMMDKGGGVLDDDMGEGMQCSDHPYRNNPGGICAFCLQEKLGKLVSSSKCNPSFFPSSSSSSPSFRSEGVGGGGGTSLSLSLSIHHPKASSSSSSHNGNNRYHGQCHYSNRTRIPFLLAQKKKKTKTVVASSDANNLVLKRSKSTATPRRGQFLDVDVDEYNHRRRGFWSFFYISTRSSSSSRWDNRERDTKPYIHPTTTSTTTTSSSSTQTVKSKMGESLSRKVDVAADDNASPNGSHTSSSSFGRKVARSRSVGCGSRSFSGDFLERISTGFGDCTLRRVESQREAKPKVALHSATGGGGTDEHHRIKERVKCGGIFGGFSMTSSSSYWLSSTASAEDMNGRLSASRVGSLAHGRSKSWGWAFASPMRAFTRPSSKTDDKDGKRQTPPSTNATPNLAALPSLLVVRG